MTVFINSDDMYRILLLVLIVNQISAQDSLNWLVQSSGESSDHIYNMALSSKGDVAIAGHYMENEMFVMDSTFSFNPQQDFTKSYFVKFNAYGSIKWGKLIGNPSLTHLDFDDYGNTFILSEGDVRNLVINNDTLSNLDSSVNDFLGSSIKCNK